MTVETEGRLKPLYAYVRDDGLGTLPGWYYSIANGTPQGPFRSSNAAKTSYEMASKLLMDDAQEHSKYLIGWFERCARCHSRHTLLKRSDGVIRCDHCQEMEQDYIEWRQAEADDENSREMSNQIADDARTDS